MSKVTHDDIKKANELREKNWSYQKIADYLKMCRTTIHYWLNPKYREERKKYEKEWRINNKEHKKHCDKEWREKNKEYKNEYQKIYYQENKEYIKGYKKQHYKENKEYYLERNKTWKIKNRKRYLELLRKRNYKRRRGLGFTPLNKWFSGSEGHHIDTSQVIYIPKELHRSIHHNVFTGERMDEINIEVFNWLVENDINLNKELLINGGDF